MLHLVLGQDTYHISEQDTYIYINDATNDQLLDESEYGILHLYIELNWTEYRKTPPSQNDLVNNH